MKITVSLLLLSFLVISYHADSQTTLDSLPTAKQEIVDWLNKKFALYTLKNPDFPGSKTESVKFDGCYVHINGAFELPINKVGDANINIGNINRIDYFSMSGGMIFFKYTDGMAYINFDISKEPDLLNQLKTAVNYLKTYCANSQ